MLTKLLNEEIYFKSNGFSSSFQMKRSEGGQEGQRQGTGDTPGKHSSPSAKGVQPSPGHLPGSWLWKFTEEKVAGVYTEAWKGARAGEVLGVEVGSTVRRKGAEMLRKESEGERKEGDGGCRVGQGVGRGCGE